MSEYVFCIPSYDRIDRQHMANYLHRLGYKAKDIVISLQTHKDYVDYKERYGSIATIIYREGSNVCDNKNNLIDYVKKERGAADIVFCSDKVKSLQYKGIDGKLHSVDDMNLLDAIIKKAFSLCQRYDAGAWGVYPTNNAYFMRSRTTIDTVLLGCFMGMPNKSIRYFDTKQPLKEDFEISLRVITERQRILRFDSLALDATFHTKGGARRFWDDERLCYEQNIRILKKYAGLVVKHPTRKNELKYIGYSTKIKDILYGILPITTMDR